MEIFAIHHRYRIQKKLGAVENITYFSGHDSLKDKSIICAIAVFPNINSREICRQWISYYEQISAWTLNDPSEFWFPIQSFGEISWDISEHLDFTTCRKNLPLQTFACYFVSHIDCSWQFLPEKSEKLWQYFFPAVKALGVLHKKGMNHSILSPWNILYKEKKIALLFPGIIPPNPYQQIFQHDNRKDLVSLAKVFYSLAAGKAPDFRQNINTIGEDCQAPAGLADIIISCMQGQNYPDAARVVSALKKHMDQPVMTDLLRHFALVPERQSLSVHDTIVEMLKNLSAKMYRQKHKTLLIEGEAGTGKTRLLLDAQHKCCAKKYRTIFIPLMPYSDMWPAACRFREKTVMMPRHERTYIADAITEKYSPTREYVVQELLRKDQKPFVILIDNLHWADQEFCDFLEYMLLTADLHNSRLLVIAAGEPGLPEKITKHQELVQSTKITLPNFNEIISSTLGIEKAPTSFSNHLAKVTANNPSHAYHLINLLLKKSILYWDENAWYMEAGDLEELKLATELSQALKQQWETLSPLARKLTMVLTCAGLPLPYETLAQLFEKNIAPTIWELYGEKMIIIDNKMNIFLQSASLYNIVPNISEEKVETSRFIYDSPNKEKSRDDFLLALLYRKKRLISRFWKHFPYVLTILLHYGSSTSAIKWLKLLFDDKEKNQWLEGKELLIGEFAFSCGQYGFADYCFQKNKAKSHSLIRLSEMALIEKDYSAAGKYAEKLKKIVKENTLEYVWHQKIQAEIEYHQGENFMATWQNTLSKLVILIESESLQQNIIILQSLYQQIIGHKIFFESTNSEDEHCFLAGVKLAKKLRNESALINSLRLLALYQKRLCNYESSLENFQKSLELARKLCYPIGESLALLGLAEIYIELACHSKAQDILQYGEKFCSIQFAEAYRIFLKGKWLYYQAEYEKAGHYFDKAATSLAPYGFGRDAIAFGYLGRTMIFRGKKEETLKAWNRGKKLETKSPIPFVTIYLHLVRAQYDNDDDQYDHVISTLPKMILLAKKHGHKDLLWQLHYQLGLAHQFNGNMEKATGHFEKAWKIIKKNTDNFPGELRENYLSSPHRKVLGDTISLLTEELGCVAEDSLPENFSSEERNTVMDKPFTRLDEIIFDYQKDAKSSHLNALREENQNLKKLLDINKKLNNEHELPALLDFIMDSAIEITNAERGFLILTSTKEKMFEVARNFEREDISNPQFEISHSITEKVIRTGLPILAKDALEEFDGYSSVSELQLHSLLAVPLMVKEKVIGALYIDNRFEKAVFSEKEKILVEAFSDQAAIAIENTRLLQENIRLNRELSAANAQLSKKVESQHNELKEVKAILHRTHHQMGNKYRYANIIGKSSAMQEVFNILDRISDKNIPVFIHGESGTGKELIARAIHFNSVRKDSNFLSENCASINESLLESELFGHVKGAFTNAYRDKKGLFELADGGTLFLDEVGDMSSGMQASLLRVLETNLVRRVGGKEKITVDARIISASNKDLKQLVEKGEFRQDLFFRLKVVQINLPPLRQRKEDISLLIDHFMEEYTREHNTTEKKVDKKALQLLMSYDWPGNIRELRNVLYNVLSIYDDTELGPSHFQKLLTPPAQKLDLFTEELSIEEYAKRFVLMHQDKYNDSNLAKILGFSRKTLWEKRKKWNLFRT